VIGAYSGQVNVKEETVDAESLRCQEDFAIGVDLTMDASDSWPS